MAEEAVHFIASMKQKRGEVEKPRSQHLLEDPQ
jgi:hypothetical protein